MNAVTEAARRPGIDAARVIATALVVLHHTAITYGAIGGWYYKEVATDRSPSSLLLVFFCTLNQAWFMGFFFLLAGYFTVPALQAKGPARFWRDRLVRLGLPLLFFGGVLGPVTIALARTARGQPFWDGLLALWQAGVFEKGPLWFAWALLLMTAGIWPWRAQLARLRPRPSNLQLLAAALAVGTVAFALRLIWPVGTEVWGLQLGYFAGYVLLFVAGVLAAPGRWLDGWPPADVQRWRWVARLSLPVLPLVALFGEPWFGWRGRAEGGVSVLAGVYAFWEPLVAWGVILGLLQRTRQRFAVLSPLWQQLARRSFAIYVIHAPVLVAVSLAWRGVAAPALLKFAITGLLTLALCHALAGLLLRVPVVRRVL